MKMSTISILFCAQLSFSAFSHADWEYLHSWYKNLICNGDRCVRFSYEYTPHTKPTHSDFIGFCMSNSFPVIEISDDHGKTWNSKLNRSNLPANAIDEGQHGYFKELICKENLCIAFGEYDVSNNTAEPLVAISRNGGDTWNYEVTSTSTFGGMPKTFLFQNSTIIMGGACSTIVEMESKYYRSSPVPCLSVSMDNAKTWVHKFTSADIPEKNMSPYVNGSLLGFHHIACNQKFCVAVGNYDLFFGTTEENFLDIRTMPLFIVSYDGGQTWQIKLTSANVPSDVSSPAISLNFRKVSCDENRCVASGSYWTVTKERRLFDVASNDGNTWNYELGAVVQKSNIK